MGRSAPDADTPPTTRGAADARSTVHQAHPGPLEAGGGRMRDAVRNRRALRCSCARSLRWRVGQRSARLSAPGHYGLASNGIAGPTFDDFSRPNSTFWCSTSHGAGKLTFGQGLTLAIPGQFAVQDNARRSRGCCPARRSASGSTGPICPTPSGRAAGGSGTGIRPRRRPSSRGSCTTTATSTGRQSSDQTGSS
jgi:hypothetical protein